MNNPPDNEIIGYEKERSRLESSIEGKIKFILIEGALGTGKTTLIRESMGKHDSVRIIVGDRTHFTEAVEEKLENNAIKRIYRKILGVPINPSSFLEKFGRPLVLYFDENRAVEEIALDLKNVVTDNPNLQAVFALTPEQKVRLFTQYPEFANRFNATAHIVLRGLNGEDALKFVEANATMPFDQQAKEFVLEKSFPQELLDEIRSLELIARENNLDKVTGDLVIDYKSTTQIMRAPESQPVAERPDERPLVPQMLDLITQSATKGGVEPIEIARLLNRDPNTIRVRLAELKKRKLITKIGKKILPFHALNQEGLGP